MMDQEDTDTGYRSDERRMVGSLLENTNSLQSPDIDKLFGALAKAQGVISNPQRNRSVNVRTRSGDTYSFKYATLDAIIDAVRKPLSENGLWFTQIMRHDWDSRKYTLVTKLVHSSGQWIGTEVPLLVEEAGNQKFGSALTFMRRYSLSALLGIAAEEDDDGNQADGNEAVVSERKPPAPRPSKIAPQKAEVPTNFDPVMIEVDTGDDNRVDWTSWGQKFIAAVRIAKSIDMLEEWKAKNELPLGLMAKHAPKRYANLANAVAAEIDKFMLKAGATSAQ